jgi:hypothetical protein
MYQKPATIDELAFSLSLSAADLPKSSTALKLAYLLAKAARAR